MLPAAGGERVSCCQKPACSGMVHDGYPVAAGRAGRIVARMQSLIGDFFRNGNPHPEEKHENFFIPGPAVAEQSWKFSPGGNHIRDVAACYGEIDLVLLPVTEA
jgi:hypothetical protein